MGSMRKYDSGSDCENIWRFGVYDTTGNFGVNYLEHIERYRCLLCDHEEGVSMSYNEQLSHMKDPNHKMLVKKLKSKQQERIVQFISLDEVQCDLHRLGFLPESIKKLLGEWIDIMMKGKDPNHTPENSTKEVKRLCEWYQEHEPLVQLELALWRNACLLNPPSEIETSPMNLVTYHLRGGWKKNKAALRHDPMIGIVITNVLPFLDMHYDHTQTNDDSDDE